MIEVGSRIEYFERGERFTGTVNEIVDTVFGSPIAFIAWDDGDECGLFVDDVRVIDA